MGTWRSIHLGAWLVFFSFGVLFSIVTNYHLGGSIARICMMCIGVLVLSYRRGDVPFWVAVERTISANVVCLLLLLIYYTWIVVGCFRAGSFTYCGGVNIVFMWKYYLNELCALFLGFLLLHNPRYRRWAIYTAAIFMLFHAVFSLQRVADTGMDLRMSMRETEGVYGVTGFWEPFAMGTLLLLGYVLAEKQMWLKIAGFCCLPVLYRAILFCGFATPVALFLIGHIIIGVIILGYGTRQERGKVFKVVVSLVIVCSAYVAITQIASNVEDVRMRNIQARFQNMLEHPEGGGYSVEDSRLEMMHIGFDSFKKSPFAGAGGMYPNNPASGGHHAFVDYLGIFGLIGGGSYILFVLLCIRNTIRRYVLERTMANAATVGIAVMYFVGGIFNPCWYGDPTMVLYFYAFPFR